MAVAVAAPLNTSRPPPASERAQISKASVRREIARQKEFSTGMNVPYLTSFMKDKEALEILSQGWRFDLNGDDQEWKDYSFVECARNNASARYDATNVSRIVQSKLAEGRISIIDRSRVLLLNPLSLVTKPDATQPDGIKRRLCVDFSRVFNPRQESISFKMFDARARRDCLQPNCWMAKLDLKNGYLHIPLHPDVKAYSCFEWDGTYYSNDYMMEGKKLAPLVFQKVMDATLRPFVDEGNVTSSYLDDVWIQAPTASECKALTTRIIDHLIRCGFTINWKKSHPLPTQRLEYLGFIFDSKRMTVDITPDKMVKAEKLMSALREAPTLKLWRRTAGFLQALTTAVTEGNSHTGPLYRNIAKPTIITSASKRELDWWLRRLSSRPYEFIKPKRTALWHTDASQVGGAAIRLDNTPQTLKRIVHEWDLSHIHSNERELSMALSVAQHTPSGGHAHLRMDNISAVSTINRGGSNRSPALNLLRKKLWNIQHELRIFVSASYVPGTENHADAASRGRKESPVDIGDWTISRTTSSKRRASRHVPHAADDCDPQDPLLRTKHYMDRLPLVQGDRTHMELKREAGSTLPGQT